MTTRAMFEVINPGPLCTVQDAGRHGWARLGVGHSGAADRPAYELANRLVGNEPGTAALECTFGGLDLRLHTALVVAITGAPAPAIVTDGPPLAHQHPVAMPAGARIALKPPPTGLRTYVGIRGGIDVAPVMGSRSTDTLSGVGPPPLRPGDLLAVGADPGTEVPTVAAPPRPLANTPIALWPGPRRDWFDNATADLLVREPYVVQSASNRVGVRLAGAPLLRLVLSELPSEGLIEGAIQVPAEGQPVVFLADHGTTGGYPVIAVVDPTDIARVAQARPGDALTFRWR